MNSKLDNKSSSLSFIGQNIVILSFRVFNLGI